MRKYILFAIIFFGVLFFAKVSWADTHYAVSCSAADVQSAINAASNGDMVVVPAGTCQWGTTVTINGKYITLQGNGVDSTIIQNSQKGYYSAVFQVYNNPSGVVRVTGFTFDGYPGGGAANSSMHIQTQGSFSNQKIRLDHLKFVNGYTNSGGDQITSALYLKTYTLVDHCTFIDGGHANIAFFGPDNAWTTNSTVGTDNASFVEDCTFQVTTAAAMMNGQVAEMYGNSQVVIRYSTIIDTKIGNHGKESAPESVRSMEIYHNIFDCQQCADVINIDSFLYLRGSSGYVYDNTFDTIPYGIPTVKMGAFAINWPFQFIACQCTYPAEHQLGRGINNTLDPLYFYNNGSNITFTTFDLTPDQCYSACGQVNHAWDFIQDGRDYYSNTQRPGYVAYTYPHPLQGGVQPQTCGNNIREGTEACDGSDLADQTCVSQGFTGGTLACNSQCTGFITTGCTSQQACSQVGYCCPSGYTCSQPASGTGCSGTCCASENACSPPTGNLLTNGDFESGFTNGIGNGWQISSDGSIAYTSSQDTGYQGSAQKITINTPGSWGLYFYQNPAFQLNQTYTISFWYKTGSTGSFCAQVTDGPYTHIVLSQCPSLTNGTWQQATYTFQYTDPLADQYRFISNAAGSYWVDNVQLSVSGDTTPPAAPSGVRVS